MVRKVGIVFFVLFLSHKKHVADAATLDCLGQAKALLLSLPSVSPVHVGKREGRRKERGGRDGAGEEGRYGGGEGDSGTWRRKEGDKKKEVVELVA